MSLTEFNIQNSLTTRLFQDYHNIMPNYTPLGWWECDLFAVSRSGYFVEYEIKITSSDFYQDAKKERQQIRCPIGGKLVNAPTTENKHSMLARRSTQGPSRFYFVLPEGVVDTSEVPEWAGIMRASMFGGRTCVARERKAPTLHKVMVDPRIIHHVQKTFYYRFWNERRKDRGFTKLEEEPQ